VLSDPERLRPGKTRQALTEQAAAEFAKLAQRLRERGHLSETVAHFINRLVFCMFAEDVDLLPNKMFKRMLEHTIARPEEFETMASDLFRAMKAGGRIGFEHVAWFNGGLFNDDAALPLRKDDIELTLRAAGLDWAEIDPSILGTLFERGLDPDKRSQLGAHYTDRDKIMLIVAPVIVQPWLAEWETAKAEISAVLTKAQDAKSASARTKARDQAVALYRAFLDRLRGFRVLDPACGSGNFLYLALLALKDLEHRASIEAEAMGLQREFPHIGPTSVKGVEINPYAAELARVSVWIGEIQWMRRNGFGVSRDPILKPLETIECRDAILKLDGTEAIWPDADVVIGNPPFLGGKLLRTILGGEYVDRIFNAYAGRVPAEADLVTYWFAKAWELMRAGQLKRAGLVATNSIRGGANRRVLEPITNDGIIYDAWDDEAWVVDGAAVRVSVICFASGGGTSLAMLNGIPVPRINADLSGATVDLTRTVRLTENRNAAFMGDTKGGAFDIAGDLARQWLALPLNPNGLGNAKVLRPWMNGMDVTRRSAGKWIVDFGWHMGEEEAALFEAPFTYIREKVRPEREKNNRETYRRFWWRHVEARQGMWAALAEKSRYIVTPTVAKHRLFAWIQMPVCPDHQLIVIARDDDTTFGILHSRGMCQ
jgi:type II restriction/modification system DNA methylase subunit YeeA